MHAPDPEGFESVLELVRADVRALLADEDDEISAIDESLATAEDRQQFAAEITDALHNASERPVPPKTAIGRFVANASVKLDNNFEDTSTPQHPARTTTQE